MFIQKGVFIGNWTPIQAFMVPVIEHKAVFVLNTVTLLIPYAYMLKERIVEQYFLLIDQSNLFFSSCSFLGW